VERDWLTCQLPSGRKLWYYRPRIEDDETPWGEPCFKLYFWADKLVKETTRKIWTEISAYGGLLVENIVQAIARDIMRDALFRCEARGLPVVLTVHDELVTEPPVGRCKPEELERIMSAVEPWTQRLNIPIAAEAWNGRRYKK
jgi:DNA polymerase